MKSIKKLLGLRIKELRNYKNISQQQLAEDVGIDQKNLSKIECGYNFPSKSLLQLAKSLNVSLPELFDFEHLALNEDNMKKYIIENLEYLSANDIKTLYRLIKSMR